MTDGTPAPDDRIKVTLFIDTWSSQCGNCRRGADPDEKRHETIMEMSTANGRPGCGVEWRYVSSNYGRMLADRIREMRPDLPFTGDLLTR